MNIDFGIKVLRSGLALEFAACGDPAGTPVLLLHGYTDSWRSFEPMMQRLPRSVRAVAVSQRGHGGSDKPTRGYRPQDFAADIVAFMDTMKLPRAAIVGHCMGAQVARRLAVDHPDRVDALVLIAAYATLRGNRVAEELGNAVARLADPIDPAFVRAFQESTIARPVAPVLLDTVVHESMLVPASVWRAVLPECVRDGVGDPATIAAPALLLWGAADGICSRHDQDALLASMPNARLRVYQGGGHALHWEEPARVADDVAAFIANAAGARRRTDLRPAPSLGTAG